MMERSGDIAGVAHTLSLQGLIELELGVVDAALPPLERSLLLADLRVTPVYAIGWEYLLVALTSATPSAKPTHRLVLRPRRRCGSGRSAIGAVSEPGKSGQAGVVTMPS